MGELLGRYYSNRDRMYINSLNYELMQDIIQVALMIYKVIPEYTKTNIYGETTATAGKVYSPPVTMVLLVEHPDTTTEDGDFGPDRVKQMVFKFHETLCQSVNLYPEIGDIIAYDYQFFEINNVSQEQHLGGIAYKSFSIICNEQLTGYTKLNIQERPLQ